MIDFLLQKLPVYLGCLWLAVGLAWFFTFRYASGKRDKAFRQEAEKILDALDEDRRRHAKMYSTHREIERRNVFDNSLGNKK